MEIEFFEEIPGLVMPRGTVIRVSDGNVRLGEEIVGQVLRAEIVDGGIALKLLIDLPEASALFETLTTAEGGSISFGGNDGEMRSGSAHPRHE